MRKTLTVPFFVVTFKGKSPKFVSKEITLPREHALEFARFCYLDTTGLFSLNSDFFEQVTLAERVEVETGEGDK